MDRSELLTRLETDFGPIESKIETAAAHIYLFRNRAIKHYKSQQTFWGDLRDPLFCKRFYRDDFIWNRAVSPEIYLSLLTVGSQYCIEMNKIENAIPFSQALVEGLVSDLDLEKLFAQITRAEAILSEQLESQLSPESIRGARALNGDDLRDHARWLTGPVTPTTSLLRDTLDLLASVLQTSSYFNGARTGAVLDTNYENILFGNGRWYLIDTMPQKNTWRVFDPAFSRVRVITDIDVFSTHTQRPSLLQDLPVSVQLFYEVKAALIQMMLRRGSGQEVIAARYEELLRQKSFALRAILV